MKNTLAELIPLFRSLTLRKVWNVTALYSSYYLSLVIRRPIIWGMPAAYSIEPSSACNLACPHCPTGTGTLTRPSGSMTLDNFRNFIDTNYREMIYLLLYFQGEPMLHADFFEMVEYAHNKGIYTMTSTNGHFLSQKNCDKLLDAGLNKLILSVDGAQQSSYSKYRIQGHLNEVLEGLKRLTSLKEKTKSLLPYIEMQFIVFAHNEDEIPDMKKLAKTYGVDRLVLKSAQIYDVEQNKNDIPSISKYSRYKISNDGQVHSKYIKTHGCRKMWHSAVVTWDGKQLPCCYDKDANHSMGNVFTQSRSEIWSKGNAYYSFRKLVLQNRANLDICKDCPER